jgi:hypothetical protein
MDAGYSGKPLADKLGIKPGMKVVAIGAPEHYAELIGQATPLLTSPCDGSPFIHIFATSLAKLQRELSRVLPLLARDGTLWVSWPKKSAAKQLGIATDLTEDVIRDVALPLGLVDVKVCAVDETWSGLKLVIRKELR